MAEKLGLKEKLDITELTAEAVAAAVDNRIVECFREARKTERELAQQEVAAVRELAQKDLQAGRELAQKNIENMREKMNEAQAKLQVLIEKHEREINETRQHSAEVEHKAKSLEEQLAKRRQQPAAVGRVAEREFAAVVGREPDFRVGPKLSKNGDHEVWVHVANGSGTTREVAMPVLVDVKKESAALTQAALTKLVRDCRVRNLTVGAIVADRVEEAHEIFGPHRVLMDGGITVLLTSVDGFVADMRLLAPYFDSLVRAQISGNKALVAALGGALTEVSSVLADIEEEAISVAQGLEKQAEALRKSLAVKLCGRVKQVIGEAHQRITEATKKANVSDEETDA